MVSGVKTFRAQSRTSRWFSSKILLESLEDTYLGKQKSGGRSLLRVSEEYPSLVTDGRYLTCTCEFLP